MHLARLLIVGVIMAQLLTRHTLGKSLNSNPQILHK